MSEAALDRDFADFRAGYTHDHGCRPQTKELPICYTFSGRRERTLDASIAARIASICGLEHHVLRIGDDFLKSYGDYVDRTVLATDGSSGATGAHEIYFNQLARELARIRLTGNFGSEILRGMSTFKPVRLADGLLASDVRRSVAQAAEYSPASAPHPVTFAAFREIPWNLFEVLPRAVRRSHSGPLISTMNWWPLPFRRRSQSALRRCLL